MASTTAGYSYHLTGDFDNRLLTSAFILLQVVFLTLVGNTPTHYASALFIGLLISSVARRGRWLPRQIQGPLLVVAGLLFVFTAMARAVHGVLTLRGLYALVAQMMILVQATELIRFPARRSTVNYIPGVGCFELMLIFLADDGRLTQTQQSWFSLSFMALLCFMLRPDLPNMLVQGRRHDTRKAGTVLCIAVAALSSGYLFQDDLELTMQSLRPERPAVSTVHRASRYGLARPNFVRGVDLQSIAMAQQTDMNSPVFTAECDTCPGYLRTLAFDDFDGWRWSNPRRRPRDTPRAIRPSRQHPASLASVASQAKGHFFRLRPEPRGPYREMVIRLTPGAGSLTPLPENAAFLQTNVPLLSMNKHGVIEFGMRSIDSYTVFDGNTSRSLERPEYLRDLRTLPPQEEPALTAFAENVCGDATKPRELADRISQYFRANHSYSLDYEPSNPRNATSQIWEFLENRSAAHCEYFATATALLLRAKGVPARLATGYLVYELNDSQDHFVARNRNAHAWVEAYDELSEKWFLVESTPGTEAYIEQFDNRGTRSSSPSSRLAKTNQPVSVWDVVLEGVDNVTELVDRYWTWTAVLLAALWAARRVLPARGRGKAQHPAAGLLRRADRLAAQFGFRRASHETCLQFAERLNTDGRLSPLASWYRGYAERRYRQNHSLADFAAPPTRGELTTFP